MEAEGEGAYYDDGWGGITEQDRPAGSPRRISSDRWTRLSSARREQRSGGDADARPATRFERPRRPNGPTRRSPPRRQARADELRASGRRPAASPSECRAAPCSTRRSREAYRDAILAYAMSRRAQNLQHSEHDGVLDIEFELEV